MIIIGMLFVFVFLAHLGNIKVGKED